MSEFSKVLIITGVVLLGLWASNAVYDRKVPQYISRKIGHATGGAGFALCVLLFPTVFWPLVLTGAFGLLLLGARLVRPGTFRGVGGNGRSLNVWAEVWFAWVAAPVFALGWGVLDKPFLSLAALLYMAWGDGITGLVRARIYGRAVKGIWGSVAMFLVCLAVSLVLVRPLWVGVAASLVATFAEWAAGDVGILRWADDNWAIPVVSLLVLIGLTWVAEGY